MSMPRALTILVLWTAAAAGADNPFVRRNQVVEVVEKVGPAVVNIAA